MMRMNYKAYPTDYVQQLNSERGVQGRKKSRAFLEYWNDMEHGMHNSERFYAKSWDVSPSTAHDWIKEYTIEIEKFLAHWSLRNAQHYTHVKNATEQNEQTQPSKTSGLNSHKIGHITDTTEQNEQTQPSEDFNLYNNNTREDKKCSWNDKNFLDLFFIYAQNTKFPGKKDDAFEVFEKIDMNVDLLKLAAIRYLHDPDTQGKRYNLTNFLSNQTYIAYLPKKIKLTLDGVERIGMYDDITMRFTSNTDTFIGQLTAKRLIELYESKQLEFING